jgi:hypothetical protein
MMPTVMAGTPVGVADNPTSQRDITRYGASIVRANVPPGTKYWKVVDAYHLNGAQNKGNHHLFADVLNADGSRHNGAQLNLYYGQNADHFAKLTVDKPANEPGTNAPMYMGNFYDIEGADLPSDKAVHFTTSLPDEEVGNTTGHHSFMVIFQETIAPQVGTTTGSIRGTVTNGAGRNILLSGNGINTSATIAANGAFGFDAVVPGTYQLAVSGTTVSTSVKVVAGQQAQASLTVPPPNDDISALKAQIAALQTQVAQLQQQVNQAAADRDRYKAALVQIKQTVQGAGV